MKYEAKSMRKFICSHIGADCCCDEYSGHGICDRDKSVCETGTDDWECTDRKSGTAVG